MRNILQTDTLLKSEWMSNQQLLSYWILVIFLLILGVFIPWSAILSNFFLLDTLAHMILYSILSLIPMILFKNRKTAFLLAIGMTPIGYILEMLHMMVTQESFSAINVLANNTGDLAGIALGFIVRLKRHYSPTGENN